MNTIFNYRYVVLFIAKNSANAQHKNSHLLLGIILESLDQLNYKKTFIDINYS